MTKECIIYAAVNISDLDGKRIYIGLTEKSLSDRKYRHEYDANRGSKLHFHRAIKKDGGSFVWLVVGRANAFMVGLEVERKFISFYKELGFELYNHTEGGGGIKGFKMNSSSKEKMAAKKRGRTPGWVNGPNREETIKKLSLKMKGSKRPPTEENKAKMVARAIKMGIANGIPVKCHLDGRFFRSANAAARYYGLRGQDISWSCRTGKQKSGLIFSRISLEEYPA